MPGEDLLARYEAMRQASRARVRAALVEIGDEQQLADWDRQIRRLDLGIIEAEIVWQSLTEPQQRALALLDKGGVMTCHLDSGYGYFVRDNETQTATARAADRSTVWALVRRGLLAWEGEPPDAEAVAVTTEKALFVLRRGRGEA